MKSLFILLLCVVSGNLYAQNWNLLQLPNETKHPEDLFNITRPALSLRGWDNARTNAETSYFTTYWHTTFGVKQVLISSFSDMETSETILFRKIRDYRNRTITTGYLDGKQDANSINSNAIILESRAFTALMTYIIDKNDGGLGEPNVFTADVKNRVTNLPNFDQARISLLSAFRQLIDYHYANNLSNGARFFTNMGFDDTFKNTTAIMAVARAFDFYLALENAALFYGDNTISNQLLTTNERRLVNALLAKEIDLVHYETSEKNLIPYNLLFGLDVTLDEVQAGNWPLISKIGIAYASLGMNGTSILNPNFSSNYFYNRLVDGIVASSPVRTLGYAQTIRDNHFFYQTQGNTSFAEGFYYYKITLSKLLPFYNVLRTNNVLQLNSITGVDDPIRHPNFEKTLHWVADLSTPDGKTLPLDDGNKVDLDISEIFRWSNVFGNQEIGQKYAWLRTRIGDVSDWFNTTSIAIPKVSAPNQSPISNVYPYSGISNADQLAVRFSDAQNRNHMVVLNTESLLAVEPSEGHEQPDQLQLLYYVDDKSIIADAGYDKGGTAEASATYPFVQAVNSSWSKMSNHNVFRMEHRESLSDPVLTTDAWIGKKANHGGIKNKSLVEHGNLYMLSGTMEIIAGQSNIFTDPKIADYRRNLLVIEGDLNTDPYIIDSNSHVFIVDLRTYHI